MHNLRYAFSLSLRAKHLFSNADLMDLVGEANYGLIEAVQHFDALEGTRFITYAHYCMWNRLKKYVRENLYPCRLPGSIVSKLLIVNKYINLSKKMTGHLPSLEEIGNVTDISISVLKRLLYFVNDEDDPVVKAYTNGYAKIDLLKDLKDHLNDDEYEIIVSVYGLDGVPPCRQCEIAQKKHVSNEMIKIKKQKAILKMKNLYNRPDILLLSRAKATSQVIEKKGKKEKDRKLYNKTLEHYCSLLPNYIDKSSNIDSDILCSLKHHRF